MKKEIELLKVRLKKEKIAMILLFLFAILCLILFYFFLNRQNKQVLFFVVPIVISIILIVISFIYVMYYRKDKQKINLYNYLFTKQGKAKKLYVLKDFFEETYDGVVLNAYLCEDEEKKEIKVFCSSLLKLEEHKKYNVKMYKNYVLEIKEYEG